MEIDKFGDALRKYYKIYGMNDEGPPEGVNVSELISDEIDTIDIDLIDKVCSNEIALKKFNECKVLLNKLAESLGDSKLIEEINDSIVSCTALERDHLTNGIFWHYLATTLNPKVGDAIDVEIPFPSELPKTYQNLLKVQGSLVFRLYMTLVYMKEGPLLKFTSLSGNNKKPISQTAKKLLKCDYVRHIRNAVSHSTFESTGFGIYFNDSEKFETVGSPEFLDSLTTWIMLLNLQCSVVLDKKPS